MDTTPPSGAGDRERALALADMYLDTVPRFASRPEAVGPFTVFVSSAPWPYYARPTPAGHGELSADDVAAVVARQRELGQPVAFEWVRETAPAAEAAIRAAGLRVRFMPLLALDGAPAAVGATGVLGRVLEADDPSLAPTMAAVEAGFRTPGTAVGREDVDERDHLLDEVAARTEFARHAIRGGRLIVVAAEGGRGIVGGGSAAPRGDVAELTGIATLPAWRRRGIGGLIAAELALAARSKGVQLAILSAADDDVARVYERVGFKRIGSVGEASGA
jgi:GNAT superfamily N-acetyltransferase